MLLLRIVFITSYICMALSSESSEEIEALLKNPDGVALIRQFLVIDSYQKNKLDVISYLVSKNKEVTENITLVGSQSIYGPDGEVVEIRTVELHIPQIVRKRIDFSADSDEDDDEDDEDVYGQILKLREISDLTSQLGFPLEVAAEEYDKNGEAVLTAFIDKDLFYVYSEGIHVVNKTIEVNSSKEVNEKIEELQAKRLPVGIHKFDSKGQFLAEQSNIVSEYLASITSEEGDADQELLDEIRKGVATTSLEYQNNQEAIPSKLSEYLNLKLPQYDFNVFFQEPKSWYVNKDYKINIRYDLNWENPEETIYSIFVLKKDEKPKIADEHLNLI